MKEIAKLIKGDHTISHDATGKIEQVLEEGKRPLNPAFVDFIRTAYDFKGDDRALVLFAAAAVHAQLYGPTEKGDPLAVMRILPFLKKLLLPEEAPAQPPPSEMQSAILQSSEMGQAILSAILRNVDQQEDTGPQKHRLTDLRYRKLYPKVIGQWVTDALTPIGYYGSDGLWTPIDLTPRVYQAIIAKQQKAAARYASLRSMEGIGLNAYPVFPPDLEGEFRFGLKKNEIEEAELSPKTVQLLTFAHATQSEVNKFRIQKAIEKWQRHAGDTGSDEVQMAVLTQKVFYLTEHFKRNKQDKQRLRQFTMLLSRRQIIMNRLKIENTPVYYALLQDLGIPDTGRTFKVGHVGGISVPKACKMSKQKQQRVLKGKKVSQKSHMLASRNGR